MSEQDPNKDLKPSAFDEWWAEVQEWRGKRQEKRQKHGHWHRKNAAKRHKFNPVGDAAQRHLHTRNIWWGKALIGFLCGFILTIVSVLFHCISVLFRFAIWIITFAALWWVFSSISTNKSSGLQEVITSFEIQIEELRNEFRIEIRTKDGEVMEWGSGGTTEKPTPPATPTP